MLQIYDNSWSLILLVPTAYICLTKTPHQRLASLVCLVSRNSNDTELARFSSSNLSGDTLWPSTQSLKTRPEDKALPSGARWVDLTVRRSNPRTGSTPVTTSQAITTAIIRFQFPLSSSAGNGSHFLLSRETSTQASFGLAVCVGGKGR